MTFRFLRRMSSRENIFKNALLALSLTDRQIFLDDSFVWLSQIQPESENDKLFVQVFFEKLKEIYTVDVIPDDWLTTTFFLYTNLSLFSQWIRRIPQPSGSVGS